MWITLRSAIQGLGQDITHLKKPYILKTLYSGPAVGHNMVECLLPYKISYLKDVGKIVEDANGANFPGGKHLRPSLLIILGMSHPLAHHFVGDLCFLSLTFKHVSLNLCTNCSSLW